MQSEQEKISKAMSEINQDELAKVTLDLARCYSPPGFEKEAGDYAFNYLEQAGISVKRIGLFPDRFNVLGRLSGSGGGYSLLFNAHLDVWLCKDDRWILRNPSDPIYNTAWQDGNVVYGNGAVNDKGPLAASLVAIKALKKSGIELKGDLLVSASPGEVSTEPIDEFEGPKHSGKDVGARFLVTHGGVADYVVIAEATDFHIGWVEAGKAWFKVTIFGELPLYTPFLEGRTELEDSPNAIVRAGTFIERFERWAREYQEKNTRSFTGGLVVPKANIGAIRSGDPTKIMQSSELCSLYIDVRLLPGGDVLSVKNELELLLREEPRLAGEVELYHFRPGYNAKEPNRLVEAIRSVHKEFFHDDLNQVGPALSSMWRDMNVFNEVGIPAVTYGPGAGNRNTKFSSLVDAKSSACITAESLADCAKVYAALAIHFCDQEKK